MANFITLSAKLEADASAFNRQVASARKAVDDLGAAISKQAAADKANAERAATMRRQAEAYSAIGGAITRYVTLPLTLAGAAAVKTGSDLQLAFGRIAGLTDEPASNLANVRKQLEGISHDTARPLAELANSFYFVASNGVNGAKAIDVVRASAKAAAAGLGDAADVGRLATAAINAYGAENITASKAVDILTAAVREGAAEPAQMAQSLGRVIPIAKEMGVSFDQVAAAVAVMTRSGADVEQAVTGIRNVFTNILSPAAAAKDQLKAIGVNADDLRNTLRQKGLLATLQQLEQQLGGNTAALDAIIPDARGLVAVLNLLGQDPAAVKAAFDSVANSAGSLDKAFNAVKDTAAQKLKQAIVDSQTELLKLGETLVPLAADVLPKIVGALKTAVDVFNSLPGPVRTGVVLLAGIAAASGPILSLVGNLKRMKAALLEISSVKTGVDGIAGSIGTAGTKAELFARALKGITLTGALVAVGAFFDRLSFNANQATRATQRTIASAGSDLKAQIDALEARNKELQKKVGKGFNIGIGFGVGDAGTDPGKGTGFRFFSSNEARKAADEIEANKKAIADLRAQMKGAEIDAKNAGNAVSGLGDAAGGAAPDVNALTTALDNLDKQAAFADALDKLNEIAKVDPFAIAERSAINLKQAQLQLADAQDRYNELVNRNVGLEQRRFDIEQRRAAANLASAKVRAEQAKAELQRAIDTGQSPNRIAEARATLEESLVSIDEAQQGVNDAQKAGANAARDLERASIDVRSAELAVKEARSQLITVSEATKQKQKDLEAAFRDLVRLGSDPAVLSADKFKSKLIELRDTFPTLAGPINDVLTLINGVATAAQNIPKGLDYEKAVAMAPPALTPEAIAYIKGVTASQTSTPSFNAPNQTEAGGSTVTSITVNVATNASPEQIAAAIDAELRRRNNRSFI